MNVALEQIGDSWSLLIVRDLMFKGFTRYADFLGAEEGIATNILADRLSKLEAGGIIAKLSDPEDGRRYVYSLTEKGIDLAPVLAELIVWASTHERTDALPATLKMLRTDRDAFLQGVREKWAHQRQALGFNVPRQRTKA
jgi:DNA-binding HxlR family transcriptional regulator